MHAAMLCLSACLLAGDAEVEVALPECLDERLTIELFAAEPDLARIEADIAELGQLQAEFETGLYDHFQQLKEICDPQQAEELRFMLINLIERTRPRGPQHHRRGPDGGFGPGHRPPPRH